MTDNETVLEARLRRAEERAEKAEENRDELARALGRWQSLSIRHEARIQELEALVRDADRFLRNGSGYREEVASWLHDSRRALAGSDA